jgi:hypothetical protein
MNSQEKEETPGRVERLVHQVQAPGLIKEEFGIGDVVKYAVGIWPSARAGTSRLRLALSGNGS